ncbi:MAG: GNAT family N-acetyltransferase [Rhodospirillales bacterium]|nr:GNAT family N-acetyltransferase [Rhodospirillales bacterium]MCB9973289.1 GNAT family N-acetyltransferase [Rhodospirillales bacterium]
MIEIAKEQDRMNLYRLHERARFATDVGIHPEYARATRDSGYYEGFWGNIFNKPELAEGSLIILKAVLEEKGIVGFAVAGAADEYGDYNREFELLGELHQIYVSPEIKGCGVGRELYEKSAEFLSNNGYQHMIMNVLGDPSGAFNSAAAAFYESRGARVVGSVQEEKKRGDLVFSLNCPLIVQDLSPYEHSMG